MPPPPTDVEQILNRLEADLRRLEAEYNMFFAGRSPRPPVESRNRVQALFKQHDRSPLPNTGARFRFSTLQARFASLVDLWDRGLKGREEGRGGPFGAAPGERTPAKPADRVVKVAAFHDPVSEPEKLRELYESLSEARKEVGADRVPFDRFAEMVSKQTERLRGTSDNDIAFRVAVKDGKVTLTAKVMKTGGENSEGGGE